ncbi:hypothetical protein HZB78_01170 [Candidatus Collierbacteria bacterium]|nr:hypothetical protein [Candidatus Collierbacteria bacterium]
MSEIQQTIEINLTEKLKANASDWFSGDISKRIGLYNSNGQSILIKELNMSLGRYGFDYLIEVLNIPSWNRLDGGLSQKEKSRVMNELGFTQSQLDSYLVFRDNAIGKERDSAESTSCSESKKFLVSAIWKTVSTEYEENRINRNAAIERYERIKEAGNERLNFFLKKLERKSGRLVSDLLDVTKGNDLLNSMFAIPSGVERIFKQVENFKI